MLRQYPFQVSSQPIDIDTIKYEITENWCEMVTDLVKTPGALEGYVQHGLTSLNDMTQEELVGVYLGLKGVSVGDIITLVPLLRTLSDDITVGMDVVAKFVDNYAEVMEYVKQLA